MSTTEDAEERRETTRSRNVPQGKLKPLRLPRIGQALSAISANSAVKSPDGAVKRPMPTTIHPMLATSVDEPFDGAEWLFEIKWDGYRAIAFIEDGKLRLVSRNQNELTAALSGAERSAEVRQSQDRDSRRRSGRAR